MLNDENRENHLKSGQHLTDFIRLYFDMYMDPIENLRFEEHLESCDSCSKIVSDFEQDRLARLGMHGLFGVTDGEGGEGLECMSDDTLREHLDGTLSESERELVEEHLDTCLDCTLRLEAIEQEAAPAIDSAATLFRNEFGAVRLVAGGLRIERELVSQFRDFGESGKLLAKLIINEELALCFSLTKLKAAMRLEISLEAQVGYFKGIKLRLEALDRKEKPQIVFVTNSFCSFDGLAPGRYRLTVKRDEIVLGTADLEVSGIDN